MAKINGHNVYSVFGKNSDETYANLKVLFPQAQVYKTKNGEIKLEYNNVFVNKFNKNLNTTQIFLDNKVIMNLQKYVSYKYGFQEQSIRYGSIAGSGKVHINVPYAKYQAYSKRIKKRVGLRGTQPFERMVADKKDIIFKEVAEYSRRISA